MSTRVSWKEKIGCTFKMSRFEEFKVVAKVASFVGNPVSIPSIYLSNYLSIELSFCLIPGIWHQSCFTSKYLLKSIYDLGRAGTSPTSTEWMRESEWGMWPGPASCNLITFWWTHHLRWTLFFFFILALQKQRRNRFWYFSLSTR